MKSNLDALKIILDTIKEREDSSVFFEKYFKIRDRETSQIIPFKINDAQRRLHEIINEWDRGKNKDTLFIIILKSRRLGFSTYVEADFFKRLIHENHKTAMIISYDDDSAKNINDMANILYQYLPNEIKPKRRASRGTGVLLEDPKYDATKAESSVNQPGLQSHFLVETARNLNAGSSYNINYLHISEIAKWQGDIQATLTSLMPAVPSKNSIVIIESTAFGYNFFKKLWDDANAYVFEKGKKVKKNNYIPLFVAWYEDPLAVKAYTKFQLTEYEKEIKKLYKLSNQQIAWRRWAIQNICNGDLNKFRQEYPISPEEAFIASGSPVFNLEIVKMRLEKLRKHYSLNPFITGFFMYEKASYRKIKDNTIKFYEDKDSGYINIYKKPKAGVPYVLGGDTAGEGSDYFAAHVIDNTTGMQVAVLHCHIDSDKFAYQMYCLGKYYNMAMIALEINFDYNPTQILVDLGYWNLYKRQIVDNTTNVPLEKYGFRTSSITRPLIINNFVGVARDDISLINDVATLEEMLEFVYDRARKPVANTGEHDDLVLSACITYYCRHQMWTYTTETATGKNEEIDEDEDDIDRKLQHSNNWLV